MSLTISSLGQSILHSAKVHAEPGSASQTIRNGQSVYQVKQRVSYKIDNVDYEVEKLTALREKVDQFHAECDAFENESIAKLNTLSIFKPETWKAYLAETVDRLIIFLFGPIFSFGTIRVALARVQELQENVSERLLEKKVYVIQALKKHKCLQTLEAYTQLGAMTPNETSHLQAIGERLLLEGACKAASEKLKSYLEQHQDDKIARFQYIQALKADRQFEQALSEIEKLSPSDCSEVEIECLVGLGKIVEAKDKLRSSAVATVAKKLLFLQEKEELSKKKADFSECRALFQGLEKSRMLILHGKKDNVEVDFWLDLIQNQEDGKKMIKGFVKAMKKIASECVLEEISSAIDELKKQKLAEMADVTLSDASLKKALVDGYKEKQERRLHGGSSVFEPTGLTHKKEVLQEILSKLDNDERVAALQNELRMI